ncbi:MAG: hypothetical protein AB1710_10550 [Pseudomonadota bacterium]
MRAYLQPWKLATFAVGMAWLFWGAWAGIAPDWDYGISLIMGLWAYVTAPWAVRVFWRRAWRLMPLALLAGYLGVDGWYWLYWSLTDPAALFMRSANAPASTTLYRLAGFVWLHNGTLRELVGKRGVQG